MLFSPLASSIASIPGNAYPSPTPSSSMQTIPAALYFLVPLYGIIIALLALSHRKALTILPQSKTNRQRTTACCYFSITFLALLSALSGAVGLKVGEEEVDGSLVEAAEVIHAFLIFQVGISFLYLTNIHLPSPFRKFTSVATLYSLSLFITLSTGTLFSLLSAFLFLPLLIPPIMLLGFTIGSLFLLLYTLRAFIVPQGSKEAQHHAHHRSHSGIEYDSIYEHQDHTAGQERGIALPVLSDGLPSPSASSTSFTEKRDSANSGTRILWSQEQHTPLSRQYARQAGGIDNPLSSGPRENPDIRVARSRAWKILLLLLLAELCLLISVVLGLVLSVIQGNLSARTEPILRIVQSALEVLCIGGVMGGYLLHAYNAAFPSAFSRPMLLVPSISPRTTVARVRSQYPSSPTSPSPLISSFSLSAPPRAKTTPQKKESEPRPSGLSPPQPRFPFGRSKSLHARARDMRSASSSFSSPFPRSFMRGSSAGTTKEMVAATAATSAVRSGQGWREVAREMERNGEVVEERRRGLDLHGEPSISRGQGHAHTVVPGSPLAQEVDLTRTPSPHPVPAEGSPTGMKRRTSKLMKMHPLSGVALPGGQKARSTLRRRGTRLPGHNRGSSSTASTSPTSPTMPVVPPVRPRTQTMRSIDSEDFTDLRDPFAPPLPGTVLANTARISQASSDSPLVFSSESLPSTSTTSLRSTPRGQRMSAWGRLPPLPTPVPSPNAPHPAKSLKGVKGVVSGWRKGRGRTKSGSSVVSSLKGKVNKIKDGKKGDDDDEEVWGTRFDMGGVGGGGLEVGEDGVLEEALLAQRLLKRLDGASSPAVGGHSRGGSSTI